MRNHQRDELFARARRAASPTEVDKRRVRASLSRALGAAAVTSVGATASKAAATVTGTAVAAVVRASATAVGKVAIALFTAGALASLAVPVLRRDGSHAARSAETTGRPSPVAPVVVPSVSGGAGHPPIAHEASAAPTVDARPGGAARGLHGTPLLGSTARASAAPAAPTVAPASITAPPSLGSARAPAPDGTEVVPLAPSEASPLVPAPSARPAPPVSDAAADLELMAKIQSALRDGDAETVLRLVGEHERRFPVSAWAEDREGARVLARCMRSAPAEAAAIGQRFLAAHSLSTLGGRVRAACHLDSGSR